MCFFRLLIFAVILSGFAGCSFAPPVESISEVAIRAHNRTFRLFLFNFVWRVQNESAIAILIINIPQPQPGLTVDVLADPEDPYDENRMIGLLLK